MVTNFQLDCNELPEISEFTALTTASGVLLLDRDCILLTYLLTGIIAYVLFLEVQELEFVFYAGGSCFQVACFHCII